MLELTNLAQFNEGLDRWLDEVEDLATDAFRGLVAKALKFVVLGTPEWSGNLAASWRITFGGPAAGYVETVFKEAEFGGPAAGAKEPFSRISPNYAAVHYAYVIAKRQLPYVRLDSNVVISNPAPYYMPVELDKNSKGASFVRGVNKPIEMVLAAATAPSLHPGELSEASARALAREASL